MVKRYEAEAKSVIEQEAINRGQALREAQRAKLEAEERTRLEAEEERTRLEAEESQRNFPCAGACCAIA